MSSATTNPRIRVPSCRASFARWFAGSAVVDQQGRPLVLFHGTDAEFEQFERSDDIGFHFGPLAAAETRLQHLSAFDEAGARYIEGCNIRPVVLSIRNPLRVPDMALWDPAEVARLLRDVGVISEETRQATAIVDREFVATHMFRAGFDGFVYANETEGGGDSWIALEARQIQPWWTAGAIVRPDPLAAAGPSYLSGA